MLLKFRFNKEAQACYYCQWSLLFIVIVYHGHECKQLNIETTRTGD